MHALDILKKSEANPNEALKKRVHELFTNRCPEIMLNNYITPAIHFDKSYESSAMLLRLLHDVHTGSCLSKIYKEDSYIDATAVNAELLITKKLNDKTAARIIISDAIEELITESNKLDIKFAIATHEYDRHINEEGKTVFNTDHIFLCHSTTAEANNKGVIEESKPQFLQQKLLAYCYVKGIIDDNDIDQHRLDVGIHARPMEHWVKQYQKEGIQRLAGIPEKEMQLQIN